MKTKEFNGFVELDKSQLRELKGGCIPPETYPPDLRNPISDWPTIDDYLDDLIWWGKGPIIFY